MEAATKTAGVTELLAEYLNAWNATDPSERAMLLDRTVADDVLFADPMKKLSGRAALELHIASVQAEFPGITFDANGDPDAHNEFVRAPWRATIDGRVVLTGLDVDDVGADGRLARIIGFFNPA